MDANDVNGFLNGCRDTDYLTSARSSVISRLSALSAPSQTKTLTSDQSAVGSQVTNFLSANSDVNYLFTVKKEIEERRSGFRYGSEYSALPFFFILGGLKKRLLIGTPWLKISTGARYARVTVKEDLSP